ncbi:hypothetical protein Glove_299g113 [Diversispora epigaea]|uniref:Uncharacterized protein n=1 Tax=Diversispora epigaea TaxID=1348612 RepID=A0A397HX38_9GLOM|nr:hypothetical protein Glove_299g113 [Diversispora epigaea]
MSQESRILRIHIKKHVEPSSLQNKPSSTYNEPESFETSKKSISASQTVHFSEELKSTIPKTVDELKTDKYFSGDSGTELEIIPSKRPKGRKLKSKKIARTNKGKRMFGNDSEEEDTELDNKKNEKDVRVIEGYRTNNLRKYYVYYDKVKVIEDYRYQ